MIYGQSIPKKKTTVQTVAPKFVGGIESVTDEMYLPQSVSRVSYNVSGINGALKEKYGFGPFLSESGDSIDQNQKVYACYHLGRKYLLCLQDKRLYHCNENGSGLTLLSNTEFTSVPVAIPYTTENGDVLIVSAPDCGTYLYNGTTLVDLTQAPSFCSMAVHYERVFGVSGQDNKLWFSQSMHPNNWSISSTEGGYVDFADDKGKCVAVVSFSDYLFLFRENGITRISAYSSQVDFSVTQLFVTSGKIYGNTVKVCGDKIIFLSEDGLYLFDGMDTKKLLENLDGMWQGVDNSDAVAEYVTGRYALALKMNFNDNKKILCEKGSYVNNAVLILDLNSGEQSIVRGVDVISMTKARGSVNKLIIVQNNEKRIATLAQSGKNFDVSLPKCWTCPITDVGQNCSLKRFRYLTLFTKYDLTLTVTADGKEYYFNVQGKDYFQQVPIGVFGRLFSVSFISDYEKMYVVKPKFSFAVAVGGE